MPVGIEALNVYCGIAYVPVQAFFEARGLNPSRFGNLMMTNRSVALPFEDPVTNAVNAAKPMLDTLDETQRSRIEVLIVSSESGIDYSKSIASYVHDHLALDRRCRLVEVKQACYAATAAVQMAAGYVASEMSPGAKVLVIATDVALVDAKAEYAEPTMGTGGAAVLIGDDPRVMALDFGAFGNYSYETMDSARPTPAFDIADVDRSLFAYLDCLQNSFEDYASRVDGADFAATFDYLAFHTPFAGLVKAGHRKMMRGLARAGEAEIDADFTRRVLPSLLYPGEVGNLCSGSVYLALASVIDTAPAGGAARVGLFSYGSGCSSEFFSGRIDTASRQTLAAMRIGERLRQRCRLSFDDYLAMLDQNLRCLLPVQDRRLDIGRWSAILGRVPERRRMLALAEISNFHRRYAWIETGRETARAAIMAEDQVGADSDG